VIGVTNEDLPARARRGEFRADLLDRLAFDVIHVPPLRERSEDIPALAFHFGVNITSELRRAYFAGFSAQALELLQRYAWPGNVRELKNTVERSVYRAADPEAELDEIVFDPFAPPDGRGLPEPQPAPGGTSGPVAAVDHEPPLPLDFKAAVAALECRLLDRALHSARHRQRDAAELLGLSYHQLRGLLRKYAGRFADGRDD
jgi:psp operon transcriptional activator